MSVFVCKCPCSTPKDTAALERIWKRAELIDSEAEAADPLAKRPKMHTLA